MSKFSDHKKPQIDLTQYLPEVYRSEVNKDVFQNAFNRLLTKDDTTRIAGFIGEGNPQALRNRQITEETPHRQTYQLAPTMYTRVGTVDNSLSFSAFQQQLELMGVDMDRFNKWGDTIQFNWIPPINLDMLVNYSDYFWSPVSAKSSPQYFTVENRCNKALSKINAYRNIMIQRGSIFEMVSMSFADNSFTIRFKHDDLFVPGFVFSTKNSSNENLNRKFWTVETSTFDVDTNTTIVVPIEPIIPMQSTPPTDPEKGSWWFDTSFNTIKTWDGSTWVVTSAAITAELSLEELATVYQSEANCVCNQDTGWDISPWDDGQIGNVVWNTALISCISHATEADWIAANNNTSCHVNNVGAPTPAPQPWDIWYDVTNDVLKQRNADNDNWKVVVKNFSTILSQTKGNTRWDMSLGCDAQIETQWSKQNEWIHKSEVQSFTGIKRATMPILEYSSNVEMNEWVKDTYQWKYRTESGQKFEPTTNTPHRFELEPIFGFVTVYVGGKWVMYMFDRNNAIEQNIDYTKTFVPGYQFRVIDDEILSDVYTVKQSEYRTSRTTDPIEVQGQYMVTVVEIEEAAYLSPTIGGGVTNTRIVPQQTSTGDVWRGYHVHWLLDETTLVSSPCAPQSVNLFIRKTATTPTPTPVVVTQGMMISTPTYQELTIQGTTHDTINLLPQFKYSTTATNVFASKGGNNLRVYVNGIRQYGNYVEIIDSLPPPMCVIGYAVWNTQEVQFVSGITFNKKLEHNDVVRIEVGPAAQSDNGMGSVPVRTIEDEDVFAAACVNGQQPVYQALTQYRRVEQIKTVVNQYPMFNVYDVISGEVVKASNIFGYAESSDHEINANVQRRIIASADGKEFVFEQSLQDVANGLLYGYRNMSEVEAPDGMVPTQWWYNPSNNRVAGWDGTAWTNTILLPGHTGSTLSRSIVVSTSEPVGLNTVENALWYNPRVNTIFQRNVISGQWVSFATPFVGGDPSLNTIWKCGTNKERFVPEYINDQKEPVPIGSPSGDWQLPDQWLYNAEHSNYSTVRLSDLVTHFTTIIQRQSSLPGFLNGGRFILTHDAYNYGLGGTIKEHNDGFDTLISAVNVTNATPVGIIEFAQSEYASSLQSINDIFLKNIVDALEAHDLASVTAFGDYVTKQIIARYQANEFSTQVYSDTSAYDAATGRGVRHWIATAPMFNLSKKMQPYLIHSGAAVEVRHHDGHRSSVNFSAAEQDHISRLIVNREDNRVGINKRGKISNVVPPSTVNDLMLAFSPAAADHHDAIVSGIYWYQIGSGVRELFRLQCYAATEAAPPMSDINGPLPDGTMYYNTITDAVYKKVGSNWVAATTPGNQDIAPLWIPVDFKELLANAIIEIEQRLFDVTPDYHALVFDYSSLTPTAAEVQEYNRLYQERFSSFVTTTNIVNPLINSKYVATNAFTWNYVNSDVVDAPSTHSNTESAGCWQQLYTNLYNTPYPHLEPWCLQGFESKPLWWDAEYRDTTGNRRWRYNHATGIGMWENIRIGRIPSGYAYPSGKISTGNALVDHEVVPMYTYFSVNISDGAIAGGYQPDDVLPPYYDNSTIATTLPTVRSVFRSFSGEITSPESDYAFGEGGPIEWKWKTSVQHVYDQLIIAFQMQPVRFMHAAFGPQYIDVDNLQVETTFGKVYSHNTALFHGDLYNTNLSYSVRGLNQWYVNFNRYTGYDTNTQFRNEWVGWTPRMTYQFGGIIDTSSFDITTKYFDINKQDYNVLMINNGVVSESWVDAFNVSLVSMPPSLVQYNNQYAWKFELDTLAAIPRNIHYYGVQSYAAMTTVGSNEVRVMRYTPLAVQSTARRIYISGEHTTAFAKNRQFTISGSVANNGIYTVASSLYESSTDRTRIVVVETIPSSTTTGVIDLNGVSASWQTGDMIVFASTKTLPAPLTADTPYYVVKVDTNRYQIAETYTDALAGETVTITSGGTGVMSAAAVKTSFRTFGGAGASSHIWYHYKLDENDIRTFTPPITVQGFQQLINIIDGYAAYQDKYNIKYGITDTGDFDPLTGRVVDWQLEVERCIEWAHKLRDSQVVINDKYQVLPSTTDNTFAFADSAPVWSNGTRIAFTTSGTLPSPLIPNVPYYVVANEDGTFRVSISANAFDASMILDITTTGSGITYAGIYDRQSVFPSFEVNPSRNNIWIETPYGVLSDVIQGPYNDIRVHQTIFDQYSRPLASDKLTVYREDGRSVITMRPAVGNDVNIMSAGDAYNYIHFGGAHLFVEGYEHFLLFNNYTTSGDLLYDAFLGLFAKKFNLDYHEKQDYSLRPTLGGFHIADGEFKRNIEGSIADMRNFYDANGMNESTEMAKHAHALIGYRGKVDYLNLLNINAKSQFAFYRGMMQTKGSVNSINAYINSRRFVDAKMDEFWAWKIAEFGENRPRIYPEIKLKATDGVKDDIRLLFQSAYESGSEDNFAADKAKGFQEVSFAHPERWVNFPEQRDNIVSTLFLDAEITSMSVVYAHEFKPTVSEMYELGITHWFNGLTLFRRVGEEWVNDDERFKSTNSVVYWKHDQIADTVRVVRKSFTTSPITYGITSVDATNNVFVIAGNVILEFDIGMQFKVVGSVSNNRVFTVTAIEVSSGQTRISVAEDITNDATGSIYNERREFGNMTTLNMTEGSGVDEFTRVNAEVIRFDRTGFSNIISIFTMNPAKHRISPAKLVDQKSHTVVHDVPLWHPALGYHYPAAAHNVDIFSDTDPALYSSTRVTSLVSPRAWNNMEQSKVWLDTSHLSYLPYYDDVITPNINDRLYSWGQLADWSEVKVYQWVTSTTPPMEWDERAATDATGSLLQNDKATGNARKVVFQRRRITYSAVVNPTGTISSAWPAVPGDQVLFSSTAELPPELTAGVKYIVASTFAGGGTTLVLKDPDTNEVINVTAAGPLTLIPAFKSSDWERAPMLRFRRFGGLHLGATPTSQVDEPVIQLPVGWGLGDVVDVYINGKHRTTINTVAAGLTVVVNLIDTGIVVSEGDIVDIIRPEHLVTDEESKFDPDSDDDGTKMVQWASDYEYTMHVDAVAGSTTKQTFYSFWVENATNRDITDNSSMSIKDVAETIKSIPAPHFVVQRPMDDTTWVERYGYGIIKFGSTFSMGAVTEAYHITPVLYREAIIRNAASYITDDDRFVMRFLRDVSLRDQLQPNKAYAKPKNKHEEWFLFRREQSSTIPHELWVRLTESMMGHKIDDPTTRVPALERELYDSTYGTDTRYGLGESQSFTNRQLALATVLEYLQRPSNDFYPADIDDFFTRNSFDTPANIKIAMDEIYNTFPATHVNNIWFDTLLDALSTRSKYKEIMKTSWIALHGIRVLEVGGLFDD